MVWPGGTRGVGVVFVPEQLPEADVLASECDDRRVVVRVKRRPDHHVRYRLRVDQAASQNQDNLH